MRTGRSGRDGARPRPRQGDRHRSQAGQARAIGAGRSRSRSGGVPKAHAAAVRDSDVGLAALLATVRRISRCCGWPGGWQMISRFRYTVSGNDRTELIGSIGWRTDWHTRSSGAGGGYTAAILASELRSGAVIRSWRCATRTNPGCDCQGAASRGAKITTKQRFASFAKRSV